MFRKRTVFSGFVTDFMEAEVDEISQLYRPEEISGKLCLHFGPRNGDDLLYLKTAAQAGFTIRIYDVNQNGLDFARQWAERALADLNEKIAEWN